MGTKRVNSVKLFYLQQSKSSVICRCFSVHRKLIGKLVFLPSVLHYFYSILHIIFISALDLQQCGISNEGAMIIKEALEFNKTLYVIDLRRNSQIG